MSNTLEAIRRSGLWAVVLIVLIVLAVTERPPPKATGIGIRSTINVKGQ